MMKQSDKCNHYYHNSVNKSEDIGFKVNKSTQKKYIMPSYHSHSHYEILYVVSGAKKIVVNNSATYTLDSTSIALLKPNVIHQVCSASQNGQQRVWMTISNKLMEEICQYASPHIIDCFDAYVLSLSSYSQKMMNYFISALVSLSPNSPDYAMKVKILLPNLLLLFVEEFDERNYGSEQVHGISDQEHAYQIVEYLLNNFHRSPTVFDVANKFNFSTTHVNRIFKKVMNTTIHKYLIGVQLIKAKEMLLEGEVSVSNVANRCGFNSAEALWRVFKKYIGCSPQEYVKRRNDGLGDV